MNEDGYVTVKAQAIHSHGPFGLIVDSVWCHTLCDPAGLAITEIELIPPADHEPSIRRKGR
jgi:hypothetical protein